MKNYEKPIVEIIDLTTEQNIMSGGIGDGFSSEEGAGNIPGM